MTEALLAVLPVLIRWLPALANVITDAVGGGTHPDEAAWCAHVAGLEDVCAAIRDRDGNTLYAVHKILGESPAPALRDALEKLASLRSGAW